MQPSTSSHSLAHGISLENPPRPSHTLRTLASHSCVPIGHGGSPVELLLAVISPVLLALVSPVPGPVLIVVVPVVPGSVMPVLPGSVLTVSLAPLGLLVVSVVVGALVVGGASVLVAVVTVTAVGSVPVAVVELPVPPSSPHATTRTARAAA
jgi:hypothetical protein